jgi:hypothetical protein
VPFSNWLLVVISLSKFVLPLFLFSLFVMLLLLLENNFKSSVFEFELTLFLVIELLFKDEY